MLQILAKALSLVLIIVIGYGIKKLGWVSADDFPKISKIVLRITLPCALITNFNDFNISFHLLFLAVIGFSVNLLQQATRYGLNCRKTSKEQAFGIFNSASYNIGAFGIPYISGFLGPGPVLFASIFDIGNSIASAGIGYGTGMALAKDNKKISVSQIARGMFASPIFDIYIFLLLMRILDIHLPKPVITFTSTVGSANTFLAMLMIGIGLTLRLDKSRLLKSLQYLGIRYCFAILFSAITLMFFHFSTDIKTVLCMLYFAPIAAMTSGFTGEADADVETSVFMTSVSIIVGIVVMPLILMLLAN